MGEPAGRCRQLSGYGAVELGPDAEQAHRTAQVEAVEQADRRRGHDGGILGRLRQLGDSRRRVERREPHDDRDSLDPPAVGDHVGSDLCGQPGQLRLDLAAVRQVAGNVVW